MDLSYFGGNTDHTPSQLPMATPTHPEQPLDSGQQSQVVGLVTVSSSYEHPYEDVVKAAEKGLELALGPGQEWVVLPISQVEFICKSLHVSGSLALDAEE